MKRQMTIREARTKLSRLPGPLKGDLKPVKITDRGDPVMALMSWDLYESLLETMEVLSDKRLTKALLHSSIEGRPYYAKDVERLLRL